MPTPKLLLIEDDDRLAPLVERHLSESGFAVERVASAEAAATALACGRVDLAILDITLPGEDGFSFCRRLRKNFDGGIIMVTARGEEADRIMGLGLGADDYLAKPFSLWELEARIRAVLRRSAHPVQHRTREIGPFFVDLDQRTVTMEGRRIELTRSEFDLLALLTSEPGIVFTRDRLLESVQGGGSDAFDRAVDTHVSNLRRKIEPDPKAPLYVKTVWGVGYRFELP